MKKETYVYPSTMTRLKAEYKIFILAFVFIVIADSIGQIQVPLGPGTLILFPIFYSLIMGVLSGPEVLKIFDKKEVKAASKLVIVAICPFIAKLGINAGASIEVILSAGPALIYPDMAAELSALASTSETISGITGIYVAIFVGIPLTKKLYQLLEPPIAKLRREPSEVLESRKKQENMEADETEERKVQ